MWRDDRWEFFRSNERHQSIDLRCPTNAKNKKQSLTGRMPSDVSKRFISLGQPWSMTLWLVVSKASAVAASVKTTARSAEHQDLNSNRGTNALESSLCLLFIAQEVWRTWWRSHSPEVNLFLRSLAWICCFPNVSRWITVKLLGSKMTHWKGKRHCKLF
jgi:hypothetical protein